MPLHRRVPPVKTVIEAVMDCGALKPFLSLAARSIREEDLQLFTGEAAMQVWEDVADKLCDGVEKFTPMHEKDLRKKTVAFAKYRQAIVRDFVPSAASSIVNVDDDPKGPRSVNVMALLVLIATYFIRYFLDMTSAPTGDAVKPIHHQVDVCVEESVLADVGDLFTPEIGQRVYYVVGFLCHAGDASASRRSGASKVGPCIAALASNFALGRDAEGVAEIKSDLPPGLAEHSFCNCREGTLYRHYSC